MSVSSRASFVGVLLLAACAEERPPIDRVQPNALDKAFFVGDLADPADNPEFYQRTAVVAADAGAGRDGLFTSSDAQPTVRVRFEITEKMLLARLTYERVEDTDFAGARRVADGQIVAAYAIESHFDIALDYNPSTGERTNVVVENTTDRPWNERTYFRVDWSRNLISSAYELDTLSQLGIYYGVTWEPVAYYPSDPGNPDAPVFDVERGYFDVTVKAFASPQVIEDEYWGDFPACWLYGSWPAVNCNPSEITLRQSYLRVTDTDYEPFAIDGTQFDMFGYFTVDRFGYDRRYGIVDDRWHRFAARWNLYERSHADVACADATPAGADVHRDDDADGTEDECADVGRGSRCDEHVGRCTLPLRDRVVRTIPWHLSPGFPEDLVPSSGRALDEWNQAMRVAILAGRVAECRRTGEDGCEAAHGWPERWADDHVPPVGTGPGEVPDVFVLCHNPVRDGDAPACGAPGTAPRLGDLRYNLLTMIVEPQENSPWGIMMDAEDPLTGEKLAGSANQWLAVLDRAASNVADLVGLLNGTIDPAEYLAGEDVSAWVREQRAGGRREAMPREELQSRKGALTVETLRKLQAGAGAPTRPGLPKRAIAAARARSLQDGNALGPGNAELAARLRALRGTPLEAKLLGREARELAGLDPGAPLSPDGIRRASPLGLKSPELRRSLSRARLLGDARRHACRRDEPAPSHLLGLAKLAAEKFPAPDPADAAAVAEHREEVWRWVREQLNQGVFAHELGHSMGLRHNFAGSFDSLNYRKGYWQLRTANGTVRDDCPDGTTDGAACVGPRWRDPMSQAELDGNIGQYAFSTVMDYPGDENGDMGLPGKYDRAALRFGYAGIVDVWARDGVRVDGTGEGQETAYQLTAFGTGPGLFGTYSFRPVDPEGDDLAIHYSQYQNRFQLIEGCRDDGGPDAVLGQVCDEAPMDVADYRDMTDFVNYEGYEAFSWARQPRVIDPQGRVRRGYIFSSDEYADTGNVPSFSSDAGADAYEQVRFLESGYEQRYILDSFRHERVRFTSDGVVSRVQARYLDAIQQIAKSYFFGAILYGDPAAPEDWFLEDGSFGPLALGSSVAFDLFARILTRPEPGYFCEFCGAGQPAGVDETLYFSDPAPQPELYLYDWHAQLGDGRYVHNDFDYEQGYFWGDYQTQVGSYYDKVWATYYLGEAFDSFVSNSREDFTDGRYKNVNFATVYPDQVRRLYGSLLTGDIATYAPWVVPPADPEDTPEERYVYPRWFDAAGVGARPAAAKLADPAWAFNEQLYAMVWGTIFFTSNWSNGFVDDGRITVLGSDLVDWPAAETIAFTDPVSGLTYRAHAVGTETFFGETRQRGIGARMLEWANRLLALAYEVERDVRGDPVLDPDGRPRLVLDAGGRPQETGDAAAALALRRYVDNVDIFRQLTATFARPLGDEDLPQP